MSILSRDLSRRITAELNSSNSSSRKKKRKIGTEEAINARMLVVTMVGHTTVAKTVFFILVFLIN